MRPGSTETTRQALEATSNAVTVMLETEWLWYAGCALDANYGAPVSESPLSRIASLADTASRLSRNAAAVGAIAVVVLGIVVFTTWSPQGAGLAAWVVVLVGAAMPALVLWDFSRSVAALTMLPQRVDTARRQAASTAAGVIEAGQTAWERRSWFRTLRAVWEAGKAAKALAADVSLAPLARLALPGYVLLAAASVIGVGMVVVFTAVVALIAA